MDALGRHGDGGHLQTSGLVRYFLEKVIKFTLELLDSALGHISQLPEEMVEQLWSVHSVSFYKYVFTNPTKNFNMRLIIKSDRMRWLKSVKKDSLQHFSAILFYHFF